MYVPEVKQNDIDQVKKNLSTIDIPEYKKKEIQREKVDQSARDILGHQHRARAFLRRCSIRQLLSFRETIDEIYLEKEEEEKNRLADLEEKRETLNEIIKLMEGRGISLDEIELSLVRPLKSYNKKSSDSEQQNKYIRCKCHIFGLDYYWSGTGPLPKPFRCYLSKGHDPSSLIMPESEWFVPEKRIYTKIPIEYKKDLTMFLSEFQHLKLTVFYKDFVKLYKEKNIEAIKQQELPETEEVNSSNC